MSDTGDIWKGAHAASPGAPGTRTWWGDSPLELMPPAQPPPSPSRAWLVLAQEQLLPALTHLLWLREASLELQWITLGALGALIPLWVNSFRTIHTQVNQVHQGQDWWLWGHWGPSFSRGAGSIWHSRFITRMKMDFCPGGFFWTSSRLQRVLGRLNETCGDVVDLRILSAGQVVIAEQMQAVLLKDCWQLSELDISS